MHKRDFNVDSKRWKNAPASLGPIAFLRMFVLTNPGHSLKKPTTTKKNCSVDEKCIPGEITVIGTSSPISVLRDSKKPEET
jgi:hypothetical protein